MFEQDYLMKQLMVFFQALTRSWEKMVEEEDLQGAADTLEGAIGAATEMDGVSLLALAPESIAQVMRVTGVDPGVTEYIVRSILLEATYLRSAGNGALAAVREAQARAIALEYGHELPEGPIDLEAATRGLEGAGGGDASLEFGGFPFVG